MIDLGYMNREYIEGEEEYDQELKDEMEEVEEIEDELEEELLEDEEELDEDIESEEEKIEDLQKELADLEDDFEQKLKVSPTKRKIKSTSQTLNLSQLVQACINGDVETAEYLLRKGVKPNDEIFKLVCRQGVLGIVKLLSEYYYGPKFKYPPGFLNTKTLNNIIANDHVDIILYFMRHRAVFDVRQLEQAVQSENLEMINLFLEYGIRPNRHTLFLATETNNLEIIKMLLSNTSIQQLNFFQLQELNKVKNREIKDYIQKFIKSNIPSPQPNLMSSVFNKVSGYFDYFGY